MNWRSAGDFLNMGGYGFYVWGSYLVTAMFILLEVVLLKMRKRQANRLIEQMKDRNKS